MQWLWQWVRELRRRRVFRMAAIYTVAAWVVVQVAAAALPGLEIPDVAIRYVWMAAIFGFPLAIIFAWRYDVTPQGIVRTSPEDPASGADLSLQRVDYVVISLLVLTAVAIFYQGIAEIGKTGPGTDLDPLPEVLPNSIAVLPFENLSGDPEQAYFVDGMQDVLISNLSTVSGLAVTSRTSTRRFAGSTDSVRTIAEKLGVERVIEGSVYRVGDAVRISLQLIDAQTDQNVWARSFERGFDDVLRMQTEIASAIANEVEIRITQAETERLGVAQDIDPRAYDAYMLGQFHIDRFTPEDLQLAAQYFNRAIEIDPDFALAYVGVGSTFSAPIVMGLLPATKAGPHWQAAIQRAIELDADLAEAQHGYANLMAWYAWDWDAAEAAFRRSIELNPSYARSRVFYSHFLTAMGRLEEGDEQMLRALQLDPLNSFFQAMYGNQLAMSRRYEDAYEQFAKTYASDPDLVFGRTPYALVLRILGRDDDALQEMLVELERNGDSEAVGVMQQAYRSGDFDAAMLAFAQLLDSRSAQQHVNPFDVVMAYAQAGEQDKAFEWLEIAHQERDTVMVYLNVLPLPDALRADPRFGRYLDLMRIPH